MTEASATETGTLEEKPEAIKQRLKARFANVPQNRSLVDELLAERCNEAQKEEI
ncbi:MAG: hypothetical protein J7545_01840 [Roseofilum sp. SBFL]|uniref:hypothetical protein n=1 Tax=unclassified Roseofilum TaxID=2620099 RepID=UPI001AFFD306|nr:MULTISPECIES: hypothetical protein [unclassified Roseofilum]MBP0015884.1 hypothetical protein [Roseofilum sp. SID3]MBP0025907.1 hypothetical protein [Roseofilum sp. SID2]MBP0038182.1 hypothetical protein [Roseofilum sp. SID1]MBP0040707.1 hypothetical protein [Roseofilum sp. SBFL]